MAEPTSGIFISYRRESAAAFAGRLYDSLAGKLGKEHVFIDIDHIEPGEDFVEVLEKKLAHAVALIVLIGRDWVTCKNADGKARLADPDDFVRLEVATALNRKVRVIPVLFDGARVPSSQDLPPDMASLSRRQAVEIEHGRFHQDAAKLIEVCEKLLSHRMADEERIAKEKAAAQEHELDMRRAEAEREAQEQAEAEHVAQAEAKRIAQEKAEAGEREREVRRVEAERKARERAEAERIARENRVPADSRETAAPRKVRHNAFVWAAAILVVAFSGIAWFGLRPSSPNAAANTAALANRFGTTNQPAAKPVVAPSSVSVSPGPAPPADVPPASRELRAGSTRNDPRDGLTYVWIPPGSFTMGCSRGDDECFGYEKPVHRVNITKDFWLGQTPVTQAAYERVRGNNPSFLKGDSLPVENVAWNDAVEYCRAIKGRLPTEAEWEYAARAGTTGARYGNLNAIAWYAGNGTHEVGQKKPNAWGLSDMLGNVWQWVADWYWDYTGGDQTDPPGAPGGQFRMVRGGSWNDDPGHVRVSNRNWFEPGKRLNFIGFRCVWQPD